MSLEELILRIIAELAWPIVATAVLLAFRSQFEDVLRELACLISRTRQAKAGVIQITADLRDPERSEVPIPEYCGVSVSKDEDVTQPPGSGEGL